VQQCEDQGWLESCFVSASEDQWVDVCEQTLLRKDRNQLRDQLCERFRTMPFTDQIEQLLDSTFLNGSLESRKDPAPAMSGGLGYEQTIQTIEQTN
jgi:hypothetical protein